MTELSNWGRWGKDDQLGTINLITPAKRKQAAALVKEGVTVSLAHDEDTTKAIDNPSPLVQTMVWTGANTPGPFLMDTYAWTADPAASCHGFFHTHLNALCHMFYQGEMYNEFSKDEVTKEGAAKLAVSNMKSGIVSRGVLMDIPRLKGLPWLEPGTRVYPEDLDAWERAAHIKVQKGDIIFVRTGRWALRAAKGPWRIIPQCAGMYATCARWLKEDALSDLKPSGFKDIVEPMHQLLLVAMGTAILITATWKPSVQPVTSASAGCLWYPLRRLLWRVAPAHRSTPLQYSKAVLNATGRASHGRPVLPPQVAAVAHGATARCQTLR